MIINIEYDVFIAFSDSSGQDGAMEHAQKIYDYLTGQNIKCFFFPKTDTTNLYKTSYMKIMQSRLLLMVCTDKLKRTGSGSVDYKKNYHLYVELDTFYAMTQSDESLRALDDAHVLYLTEDSSAKQKHSPEALHPLFNNRNSFHIADKNDDGSINDMHQKILEWVKERLDHYESDESSNELIALLVDRGEDRLNSLIAGINFQKVMKSARSIKCIGISNWTFSLVNGCKKLIKGLRSDVSFEMIYLNPKGTAVKLRMEEEGKDIPKQIQISFDMMRSELGYYFEQYPNKKENLKLYVFDLIPRDNLIFIYTKEDAYLFAQSYSHAMPGSASPCILLKKSKDESSPLFEYYESVYQYVLNHKNTRPYSLFDED